MSAVLAAATLPGIMQSAAAQSVNPNSNRLIQQNQLQQLRNSFQRQQFQQQQQQYRDQDRQIVPQPRPEVPVVRQSCPIQIVNNQIVRVCR
ncbi:hypothetical protein H0241_20255 [Mesorhizobium sp. CCANP35]|uniref:Uncharacterized protein n=2 Tax=Mesorhizobium neociceri TaxID=1307853 RepID=A0A838B6Z8_9HYPH|nr:hypothetical protein [Mesorhizobium neociceri]